MVDFFDKCKKIWSLLIITLLLHYSFFRWNMWHLSRKQLIKFLFELFLVLKLLASLMRNYFWCTASYFVKIIWCSCWFCTHPPFFRLNIAYFAVAEGWLLLDIGWFVLFLISKKDIFFYSYTSSYVFHIKHPSFTKCSRVRICFILSQQKMVSHIVWCKKWIFYLNWNHWQICKECSQTQNTNLLYKKLLPIWYFELQPDYVESTYTPPPSPELPGHLFCFLLTLNGSVSGYGYANSCSVQISGHIDIAFCLEIDKRCN